MKKTIFVFVILFLSLASVLFFLTFQSRNVQNNQRNYQIGIAQDSKHVAQTEVIENSGGNDKSQPIFQTGTVENLNILTYSDFQKKRACDLSFIKNINNQQKAKILGIMYNDFMMLRATTPGKYKCLPLPSSNRMPSESIAVFSDYGTDHFINSVETTPQGDISSANFASLYSNSNYSNYNNIVTLSNMGKNYQGVFFKGELASDFNINGIGIVILKENNLFKAYEFVDETFKNLEETDASKNFLACIEQNTSLSGLLHSTEKGRQGMFKTIKLDYSKTLVDEPRFLINYTLQEKNFQSSNHCFKLIGSK